MVVSINILTIVQVVEMIALCVFFIFLFAKKDELSGHVVRLLTSAVLSITNILEIPMLVQEDKSYILSLLLAIIWILDVIMYSIKAGIKIGEE